jgi:heat shock protein HtpX
MGIRALPSVRVVIALQPNALALERIGKAGTLVVSRRLLELGDDELDAILAHEMFHLATAFVGLRALVALFRGMTLALADTRVPWHLASLALLIAIALWALGPAVIVFASFVAAFLVAEAHISREREFLADAQAVLVTRHPEALSRALTQMASQGLPPHLVSRSTMTADAERLAASLWTVPPSSVRGGIAAWLFESHPPTSERLRRIAKMS